MNQTRKTSQGFTILELMITVTIAGIIAAFAIPDYTASLVRANEKDIIKQMNIIHAAQNSYYARSGNQFIPNTTTVAALNTALDLNIIANGNTYTMIRGAGGTTYSLTVTRTGATAMRINMTEGAWDPRYTGVTQGNPRCVPAGGCPTLR